MHYKKKIINTQKEKNENMFKYYKNIVSLLNNYQYF